MGVEVGNGILAMPYVNCPCGAPGPCHATAKGWRPELGKSFSLHYTELQKGLKMKGRLILAEFGCERLTKPIALNMTSGSA